MKEKEVMCKHQISLNLLDYKKINISNAVRLKIKMQNFKQWFDIASIII